MPQYMLLIQKPDGPVPGDPAENRALWQAYTESLSDVAIANGRLEEIHSATTIRERDGETLISDGPFAETKEYLAGFYLIDVPDLDTALAHAARMPAVVYGSIEVRPMMYPAGTVPRDMVVQAEA
jgi:hypothetical protein